MNIVTRRAPFIAALGIAFLSTSAASLAQPSGGLVVQVTRGGAPVANATVCVGVSGDLNQHFQGQTGTDGRVRFNAVPRGAFVVTAHSGTRGAQQSFSLATPGTIPMLNVAVTLPAAGGPTCPTTPAGPSRLIPRVDRSQVPEFEPITWPGIVLLRRADFCFGALGMNCGEPQGNMPAPALCSGGRCFVNGGSWDHDECCVANPQGMACRRGPLDSLTGHDGNCVTSWNKAVRLVSRGLFWERQVDFSRQNRTGQVEFALYCAPANALLPPEDAAKCCSRRTRALTLTENAAARAAGETLQACQ
jgi:hypothetical protein